MVSHRAINDIIKTPKKEVHFFFFSVCCVVFNCSWRLTTFDKKQKSCAKRIHLVIDDGLYDRQAFYTVKIVFYSSSITLQYSHSSLWKKFIMVSFASSIMKNIVMFPSWPRFQVKLIGCIAFWSASSTWCLLKIIDIL